MSFSIHSELLIEYCVYSEYRSTSSWSEEEIQLNNEASPVTGKFSLDVTPYVREILDDRERLNISEQFIFTATQWAKTMALFICAGKSLDDGDGKSMLVIPTQDMVSTYVKEKVDPFIESISCLKEKIESKRVESKAGKLESALKVAPAASLRIAGNTAHTRSSFTIKNLFMDEVRLFKAGHVEELRGRTKAFEKYGRKILGVSSKESDECEATRTYEKMECKKVHHTYCRDCEELFYATSADFGLVTEEEYIKKFEISDQEYSFYDYKKYAVEKIHINCPNCGFNITNEIREEDIKDGKTKFIITEGDPDVDTSIGYKSNSLYSLLTTLEAIASEVVDARGDVDKMSRLYRDYFNEVYINNTTDIDVAEFLTISNGIKAGVVPRNTWKLILGVDNQKDHLYFELNAYTYGSIKHVVAHGKVMGYGIGEDWDAIYNLIQTPLVDEDGASRHIDHVGIDRRGYNIDDYSRTDEANAFVIRVMEYAEDNGIEDELIYAMEGVPKIAGDAYYKTRKDKENTTESDEPLTVLSMSNIKIKNRLSLMVGRSINKATGDEKYEKYDTKMMFINQTIIDEAEIRVETASKNGREYKTPKDVYEAHYTSEVYDVKKGIWVNDKQRRVDYLDCGCMCETIAMKHGIDLALPQRSDLGEREVVDDMLGVFG